MNCLRVFFKFDSFLPDDIVFDLKEMVVDRDNPDRVRLIAFPGRGSALNMKATDAIRYGFAKSREDAMANKFYLEKELKTDEDFEEFYRIYEYERHNDEIEACIDELK